MKKKILSESLLILAVMIIGIFSTIPTVNAADASISVPASVVKGEKFTVTVNIPSEAVGYQGKIKVTYSDGKTSPDITEMLVNVPVNLSHPGNMTATFTAKATGTATVSVEDCVISNAKWEPLPIPASKTISIVENKPQTTTPDSPSTQTPTTSDNNNNNNNNNSSNNNNNNSNNTTTNKPAEVTFTDVNEAVVTNDRVNLRKSYSTSSEKITTLDKNTKLTRTGVSSNGWSRVTYNGQTGYIYTQYLTKNETPEEKTEEKEVKITDVNETVYANQNCNLRKSWTTSSDKAGYLKKGQEITRTGITDNGWSRVKYNGKDVFVLSSLITKEKPEEVEEEPEEEPQDDETTEIEEEKTELEILQEEIGVLPEVGNNISTTIYIVTTIISILGVLVGLYYINKKDVK